ncbi:YitT family protein [Pseudomonas sp. W5-36]|uniref:YitT family protein n=1 Tax=Pseudomonas sp. W5-36 TaxID=3097455 RepID=UPI00397B248C
MTDQALPRQRHSLLEDIQSILVGTLLIAFGMSLYADAHLVTGGGAGLGLLGHYLTGWSVGTCFFLVNLPFYYLGYKRLGVAFILRTCAAVCSLAALSIALPGMISYDALNPLFAALVGGALIGVGLVLICRHGASLGGVIIVSLYLQEKYEISAGKVQLVIDCLILLAALVTVSWGDLLRSIAGAAVINLIMIFNFKKYRYNGFS